MTMLDKVFRNRTIWWTLVMLIVVEVTSLSGPHVCMVKQKYNVTKRVKYRAPMSVRTYKWCFAVPPRCSEWNTEMKDLTRVETEERTADMAVCCPGYKMKDISCIPICPDGKTGAGCLENCPRNKWGPNCVNDCKACIQGTCSPITGECLCQSGWQGESCNTSLSTTKSPGAMMESLTTANPSISTASTKTTTPTHKTSTFSSSNSIISTLVPKISVSTAQKNISQETATNTSDVKQEISNFSHGLKSNVYDNDTSNMFTKDRADTDKYTRQSSIYPYNRTEPSSKSHSTNVLKVTMTPATIVSAKSTNATSTVIPASKTVNKIMASSTIFWTSAPPKYSEKMNVTETTNIERRGSETTQLPSTVKFKPKEIWIRPAQKGEHYATKANIETKAKTKETPIEITTLKTIVVSIIPTSVSYASFKRIVMTTASFITQNRSSTKSSSTPQKQTIPITSPTVETTAKSTSIVNILKRNAYSPTKYYPETIRTKIHVLPSTETRTTPISHSKTTNSMKITEKLYISSTNDHKTSAISQSTANYYTIPPPITTLATNRLNSLIMAQTVNKEHVSTTKLPETAQKNASVNPLTEKLKKNDTIKSFTEIKSETNERYVSDSNVNPAKTTKSPMKDEGNFHILTEPEHITAVMSDKGNERSSVDLISVISIAGGVMMAIITVAVVIVMIERCKKPRYEDDRKYNQIRMQVMVDDNDINDIPPPPYVRSIFHTPLPEPPSLEKCHYQPISTLDRNLKQFMRPVVVQTISPLMLENFRGILECHYDHLPRRSHDCDSMQMRSSVAPSVDESTELLPKRAHSLTDSTIEAMKCEATFDVIDSTTSEPLYAEIPCWRPSLEHAVEVINLSTEAVTEL